MTGVGDDSRGRLLGRPWLVVGLLLAIGATLALVLSDDLRFLRLGIVAALWAALIGAFLAVRYRKHAAHSEDAVAEAQAVYELELEREIAARREYELEIEAETKEAAEAKSREELDALRAEVASLRESLQTLFGGEVLLERVALTAQATRMRSLNDEQRLVSAGAESKNGNGKKPAQLLASAKPVTEVAERPTELMDRVVDSPAERRRKPANGAAPHGPGSAHGPGQGPHGKPSPVAPRGQQLTRPKPARVKPIEPDRRPADSEPTRTVAPVARDALEATRQVPRPELVAREAEPSEETAISRPGTDAGARRPQNEEPRAGLRAGARAEDSRSGLQPASRAGETRAASDAPGWRPGMRGPRPAPASRPEEPRPAMNPAAQAEQSRPAMTPAVRADPSRPAMNPAVRADQSRPAMNPAARAAESRPVIRAEEPWPGERPADGRPGAEAPVAAAESTAAWKPAWDASADFADRRTSGGTPPKPRDAASSRTDLPAADQNSPKQPSADEPAPRKPSRLEQFSRADLSPLAAPATHHGAHSSEDVVPEAPAVNPTLPESVRSTVAHGKSGGRRRRSDDEGAAEPAGGRRRRPDGEPPAWENRGAAEPEDDVHGSHTAGRSVTELLAANGAKKESAPRRRRRAED